MCVCIFIPTDCLRFIQNNPSKNSYGMASKVSTPIIEMAAVDGPLPVNRFKVVKIDQRLPGKTGLKGELE